MAPTSRLRWLLALFAWGALSVSGVWGFHPESPEVVSMVNAAAKFLEDSSDGRVGGRALVAMALLKSGRPAEHPQILGSVQELRELSQGTAPIEATLDIYETSVSIIFLCEVDPGAHSAAIKALINSLVKREKAWGAWGYPDGVNGRDSSDTSMTQYALLACWMADRSGAAKVPQAVVERACNWLLRTQDPSGQWGYQGIDPGNYNRVPQQETRHSLTAAGLGSCFVCGNFLGLLDEKGTVLVENSELPSALVPVLDEAPTSGGPGRTTDRVDARYLRRAIADGNLWFERNYRVDPPEYELYYLYTYERYRSFQELVSGRAPAEPVWYDNGVRFLQRNQSRAGDWNLHGNGSVVDTSFAILFLKRSARQSIKKALDLYDGLLSGGRGLPKSTDSLRIENGQLVRTPFQGTADRLLAILEGQDAIELESMSGEIRIEFSRDRVERANQLARLRRMVNAEQPAVRAAVVRGLGEARELDNVPALIHALTDPDPDIARQAEAALRNVSRKFKGIGEFRDAKTATEAWKRWYLAARPDASF